MSYSEIWTGATIASKCSRLVNVVQLSGYSNSVLSCFTFHLSFSMNMSKQSSPSKPPISGPSKVASGSTTSGQPQGLKKLRRKKRAANLNRALDEFDDVDDNDLVAGPSKRRRTIEDYDDEEDEGYGEREDVDRVGEGEEDEEEDDDDEADPEDPQVPGNEVPKEADPLRLEKINTKRKQQA